VQTLSDLRAALAELRGTAARLSHGSGILVEQPSAPGASAGAPAAAAAAGASSEQGAPPSSPLPMRGQRLHVSDFEFFERTSS
jgi:hypothetical protein